MQLRETNLKQQLLRTQLDPHFLSNSLLAFKNLVREGEYEKALGYMTSLGKFMRFKFENASEDFVNIKYEMEALDAYLAWQTMYRPGLFEYRIDVYEGFDEDEIFIPPMLLQPLVENAIEHGFAHIHHKGFLHIEIQRRSHTIYCRIEDNGEGMKPIEEEKVHSTKIIQQRLALLSWQTGRTATLNVTNKTSEPNAQGVLVEVEIPFRHSKKSDLG